MSDLQLTILGCGSALPAKGRMPSSQFLKAGKYTFLIDCGEGTQHLIRKYRLKLQSISHICISHMHGDHFLGLMGLLFSMRLLGREKSITLIGPRELEELIELHLKHANASLGYEILYLHTQGKTKELLLDLDTITVHSLPLDHKIPTTGFLFREKPRPRKLIKEQLQRHEVPIRVRQSLTQGEDYVTESGQRISNAELTTDPEPPHSYAYCSDTAYKESLIEDLDGAEVLYHESTFMEKDRARAEKTRHSTAAQAALIAKAAGVKKQLLLGHYSARYDDLDPLLHEAREVFPASVLSQEGMVVDFHNPFG
ncbi:MAG: ribonuclease Z [Flavobacteriales bacterium]|nr:ribonuclease Z [Flavobacteriales bacterium]